MGNPHHQPGMYNTPNAGPGQPMMQMPPQMQQPIQQVQQPQPQMSQEQRYLMACHQIIPAVVPENPNYKDQVGTVLYEHINNLVGAKAPKVTGMLIDLPIEDIKLIMQDWSLLQTRVQQASELLDNQPQ